MTIHVVQPGETIYTIAEQYNVSVTRLVEDNGLINPDNLVIGQTIVITYPEQVYIVREGDSLQSIANSYGVPIMQLLRNNPFLSGRDVIYEGELLVISYDTQNRVSINAFAYPFINRDILRKTLPYLTYLTIFNYRSLEDGEIVGNDETEVIQIARAYGVAPIMSLSTLTYQGTSDIGALNSILYNEDILTRHIENILTILRTKEYYGLNFSVVNLNQENQQAYDNFITRLSYRLKEEGYLLFITISPKIVISTNEVTFEKLDYTTFGQVADGILLLSYGWGYAVGPPSASTPAYLTRAILDYAITMIPRYKIETGISTIGYQWQRPYIIGVSRANSLNTDAAIELALQAGVPILFDEYSQAPYYEYTNYVSGEPVHYMVWFKDARSIDALMSFIPEYGIQGAAIWNIMSYFTQMWLVINSQYEIIKIFPEF
ncbi:spore germination protein [Mobilisporobacter senegalensis]|uniref:Spore germination protein n=1 Tax=Mobilisporobacter senegalensis TaxID=1329262 RepID=A0A3N1XEX2_9FIRM|nr:LysM peptidoglycan-binding domain-containing protein [Mobilisporobacter senegalensis]ROR25244.1 spore germination protein [Mobilisporobacter senegalensis]